MTQPTLETLRLATEDDIAKAIENAIVVIDASPTALLEFFNAVLDVMGVPDADGDVAESAP